jgi:hypothetical protein
MPATNSGEEVLRPFLDLLDGTPVPEETLVEGGRRLANGILSHGESLFLCDDGPWQGVWYLEHLTDAEAVTWGLWVASRTKS